MPIGYGASDDELLRSAYRSFRDAQAERALDIGKVQLAREYDVPGMTRAATICHWGRSGSLLLLSYLDHHPHVAMLPYACSEAIYNFLQEYDSLSIWEKLIAYPTYSALKKSTEGDLFLKNSPSGDFAIEPAAYYDAVLAFFQVYGIAPSPWLDTRAGFFKLLHAVYGVAIGRQPATPRPIMVHSQHYVEQRLAERFVEDFPDAKFIHTVRDPITAIDSWFDRKLDMELYGCNGHLELMPRHLDIAVATMIDLLAWDRGHRGMESRTRAVGSRTCTWRSKAPCGDSPNGSESLSAVSAREHVERRSLHRAGTGRVCLRTESGQRKASVQEPECARPPAYFRAVTNQLRQLELPEYRSPATALVTRFAHRAAVAYPHEDRAIERAIGRTAPVTARAAQPPSRIFSGNTGVPAGAAAQDDAADR